MILLDVIENDLSLTWVITSCCSVMVFVIGALWRFALRDKSQCAQIKLLKEKADQNASDDKDNFDKLYTKIKDLENKSDTKDREQEEKITLIRERISKLEK